MFFLLTPLILVVLFAFTDRSMSNFPINHVSLQWWEAMLEHREFGPALNNSLIISSAVGLISAIVGTMAAIGLARLPEKTGDIRHRARIAALDAAAAGARGRAPDCLRRHRHETRPDDGDPWDICCLPSLS